MSDPKTFGLDTFGASAAASYLSKYQELPVFSPSPIESNMHANSASEFHKRLVTWINEFDDSLDQDHEVGARLVSFGQAITFHLTDLTYWNPSLIMFHGLTESEEPVQLIQHVTQISILLMKVARKNLDKPKRRFGFKAEEQVKAGG